MLKELIDKYYQKKREDREKIKFYATDAGKCPRQIFFKFKKAPAEEMDARMLRIFDQGNYVHLRLMRDLFALNIVVASEIDIPLNDDIAGRADAIVRINNELYVVDFKSINSSILSRMKEPKEEHVLQLQIYLHFFGIKKGVLLYEGKDNSEIKEFIIDYDRKLAEKTIIDFKRIKKNLEQNLIPAALPDWPKNWQCQYCQFRKLCEMIGPGNYDWLKFKKELQKQEQEREQEEEKTKYSEYSAEKEAKE